MSKIKDIFNGEKISIWDDGDFVTINLGLTTIGVPKEDWAELKKEFLKIGNL